MCGGLGERALLRGARPRRTGKLRTSSAYAWVTRPRSNAMSSYSHELKPGDAYAPLHFSISRDVNEQYLFALGDYDKAYLPRDGNPLLVHPVLLLHMSARTRSPSFKLAPNMGSVFAKERVTFLAVAYVDEPLEVQWIVREVYEHKRRLYQGLDTSVRGADGREILRRDAHSLFVVKKGAATDGTESNGG